jgi:CheY-like chemotaxis protein
MLPRTIGPKIAIGTVLDGDAWPAMTEHGQLDLALLNLAINARDAMPEGGKLTIATKNVTRGSGSRRPPFDPGDYVMISVADTGSGMTEEVRSRAFEPFFTTKGTGKGTGLGLAMVYGFVKQSGGTITIDSEIGRGTVFRIYLPRAPRRLGVNDEAGEEHKWNAGPPARILVVDDNGAVRTITAVMLRTFGHDAVEAASGQDALTLLERDRQFDLLIIDLSMPDLDGAEFAASAEKFIPEAPTLFITGYAEASRLRQRAGGEVLKKPFRRAQLAEKLRQLLPAQARRQGAAPKRLIS